LTLELAGHSEELVRCRALSKEMAEKMGFSGKELHGIVSAVFEACANAVTHGGSSGGSSGGSPMSLSISIQDGCFEAVVKDHGCGFEPPPAGEFPLPLAFRGRGIPMMRAFMDSVQFDFDHGCTVILKKYLVKEQGAG